MLLAATIFACSASLASPSAREVFVSPSGNDSWSGSIANPNRTRTDGPFRTLERAKLETESIKRKPGNAGAITVSFRGGTYRFSKPVRFGPGNSGEKGLPITYRSMDGEQAVFTGSNEVTNWTSISDRSVRDRLSPESREHVLQANLRPQGISKFGRLLRRGFAIDAMPSQAEVIFKGKPMTLARWPNAGAWIYIIGAPNGPKGGRFNYDPSRPASWKENNDIWVHGYWTYDWAESYEHVKSIDTVRKEIETDSPHGVYGYKPGGRFYFVNVLEELDAPGEYYLDRESGTLYFWPPSEISPGDVELSQLDEQIVDLQNVSDVTFQSITLENGRGKGVLVRNCNRVRFEGCTIRNFGTDGITVSGTGCAIQSCDIYGMGDGGIELQGGNRMTLTPGNNLADNNDIHDCNRWNKTYFPGIRVDGVGNKITRNFIHDLPHSAILGGGNDHMISGNEMARVCTDTDDAGAFYMGRDWTMRGNVVQGNYFHDLGKRSLVQAVYLDDCLSGTVVKSNIFYRAGRGIMVGGGRDNQVIGNLFVECNPAVHVDARGKGWASFWFNGNDRTLFDRLRAVNGTGTLYTSRYPGLKNIEQDDPAMPKGTAIWQNVCYGGKWLDLLDNLKTTDLDIKQNWTNGDPGFVDASKGDFRLKANSQAVLGGFELPELSSIGIYRDTFRESIPVRTGPQFGYAR